MDASYDPDADASYVRVQPRLGPVRTEVAEDGTILDLGDESGDVISYELLSVGFRGLDAFQMVPEPVRRLVVKAMEAARAEGRSMRVTDAD